MKIFLSSVLVKNKLSSSRGVKSFIKKHEVCVNGRLTKDKTLIVDNEVDVISVDGRELPRKKYFYIMLNKPLGTVCSRVSDRSRTIYSLFTDEELKEFGSDFHSVGRLDKDTAGLLLLTNNGKFSQKITSPESNVTKTYYAELKNTVDFEEQKLYTEACKKGVLLPPENNATEYKAKPCSLVFESSTSCFLTISEGKFHQVRRTFRALGNEVVFLERKSIEGLKLDEKLARGDYRFLEPEELLLLNLAD